jgi:hypothetical protein
VLQHAHDLAGVADASKRGGGVPQEAAALSQASNCRRVVLEIRGVSGKPRWYRSRRLGSRQRTVILARLAPSQDNLGDFAKIAVAEPVNGRYLVARSDSRSGKGTGGYPGNHNVPVG